MSFKHFKCKLCDAIIVAFEDDVERNNEKSYGIVHQSAKKCEKHEWEEIVMPITVMHGEAGFMTQEIIFDSINTIHEQSSREIQIAEDEREAKAFLDHERNK